MRQFPVRAQHVGGKMLGDEAHFSRRRAAAIGRPARPRSGSSFASSAFSFAPASSSPTRPAKMQRAPSDGDVARDVAGAADIGLAALDRDHRRRRFRRNARHLAIDEFVEHEVADAEHGLPDDRLAQGFKIEHLARLLSVASSAKAIGAVEKTLHVSLDRVFQRGEAAIISGARSRSTSLWVKY